MYHKLFQEKSMSKGEKEEIDVFEGDRKNGTKGAEKKKWEGKESQKPKEKFKEKDHSQWVKFCC